MDRKLKIDTKSIKKTIDRTPEDYEPEIEKISYRKGITRTIVLLIGNFIGLVALVPLNIGISMDNRSNRHNFFKFDKFPLMANCIQSSHAFSTCDSGCWKLHIECAAS